MLRKPFDRGTEVSFEYDLHGYFNGILSGAPAPLQKKRAVLRVTPKIIYTDIFDYAKETVWYGRRRGASVYGKQEVSMIGGEQT